MNGLESIAKVLLGTGVALIILGGSVWLLSRMDFVGRLPGDIRVERDGLTCLIPVVSSLVLSVVLTVVLNIIVHLINR